MRLKKWLRWMCDGCYGLPASARSIPNIGWSLLARYWGLIHWEKTTRQKLNSLHRAGKPSRPVFSPSFRMHRIRLISCFRAIQHQNPGIYQLAAFTGVGLIYCVRKWLHGSAPLSPSFPFIQTGGFMTGSHTHCDAWLLRCGSLTPI